MNIQKCRITGRYIFTIIMIILITTNIFAQPSRELKNDPDWIIITSINTEIMNKCINSSIDPSTVDFSNQTAFLSMLGMTQKEYDSKHQQVKEAAQRLITKYGISVTNECIPCNKTNEEISNKLKGIISYYRANPGANYDVLVQSISSPGGGVPCCPPTFYVCCLGCATTIEFFPAYLFCCYLCGCGFCCPSFCVTSSW